MVDSAIVGHLGTPQLAGLGVAAALLTTAVSIFVFLAYATTAAVARRVGAGDLPAAIRQGMDGIWLALLLGVAVIAVTLPTAPWLVELFGASDTAAPYAITYLRISSLGIPAMLIVLAATGVLRGLQDTRTPLYVAIGGFAANARPQRGPRLRRRARHRRLRLGHGHRPVRHGRRLSDRGRTGSASARRLAAPRRRRDTGQRPGRRRPCWSVRCRCVPS